MALAFTHLSWWLRGGKEHEPTNISTGSSSNSNSSMELNMGMRENETLRVSSVKMNSTSRRTKKKWQSREERRIDKEYDLVLVPSDGGCLSGSESDDSDYSIGWMEPHAPDFLSDDESESSFAVLVPCYGHSPQTEIVDTTSRNNRILGAIVELTDEYSAESKKFMEQWLTSIQNS